MVASAPLVQIFNATIRPVRAVVLAVRSKLPEGSACIVAAMLVLGLQAALELLFMPGWIKAISVGSLLLNLYIYQGWLAKFQAASKWQERNPGQLCFPHHSMIFFPGAMRFSMVVFSLILLMLLIPLRTATSACPGVWLLMICCGMCFAGVMPPDPGARREKQERALAVLAPAPS